MRIKVDEDLPRAVALLLRVSGHDARTVLEQEMGGWKDRRIWHAVHMEAKKVSKRTLFALAILVFVACAKPTIDTSTDEAMRRSVAKVRESLPEEQRDDFDNAIRDLALADIDIQDFLAQGPSPSPEALAGKMKQRLQGKTGEQILADAEKLREERERKEREQALGEIAELEQKLAAAEAAKQRLAAFSVTRSRLYRDTRGFMPEPVIELSVTNGTESPISRAYFHGVVASPGRSVPWIRDDFNYSIPGGLEPGESATWKLSPNMFSGWGTKVPPDAVFTVAVVRLDGPEGKTLYDAEGLSESEQLRLAELKKKYFSP